MQRKPSAPTFEELGIPFVLFLGPSDECGEFAGSATCLLCDTVDIPCFTLGIGAHLVAPCPACGMPNGLDADDRRSGPCRDCGASVGFPPVPAGTPITVCYPCLRSGRAAFVHDTERGMELWTPDASTDADRWELLRTPTYVTWQGERWLYCCDRPMAYLGEWQTILAGLHAPNNPRQFFEAIAGSGEDDEGEGVMLGEVYGALAGGTGPVAAYVFRCRECGAHRAHWDFE